MHIFAGETEKNVKKCGGTQPGAWAVHDFKKRGHAIGKSAACRAQGGLEDAKAADGKGISGDDEKASPGSPFLKNLVFAYVSGGAICCLGQALLGLYLAAGLPETQARGFVSVTLIGLSATLTAVGVYDKIAQHCGAGTLVPITGFANAVVSPAIEFKSEKIITGTCAKLFAIAGPVIAIGTAASVVYGLALWVLSLL